MIDNYMINILKIQEELSSLLKAYDLLLKVNIEIFINGYDIRKVEENRKLCKEIVDFFSNEEERNRTRFS